MKKDSILDLLEYTVDQNSIPLLYSELARIYEKRVWILQSIILKMVMNNQKKSQNYLGLAENARKKSWCPI
jgi:hypothetical protein